MNNFWRDRKVLITGSAGFLGCWLSNYLAERGASITGIDLCIRPRSNFDLFNLRQKTTQITMDISDYGQLRKTIENLAPEVVFHLAARPLVTDAHNDPLLTFESNVRGTWNVLEALRHAKNTSSVVVASSDKAYGVHETLPYEETARLQGSFPYDVSKSATDLIALSYFETYGLPVSVTRCGNFYGGGDLYFDRIVPGTIKSFLFDESPLIRSDGKFIRDYIYVKDVVEAYVLLAEKINSSKGHAFNFSTEDPIDVLTIVGKIAALMGKSHLQPKVMNIAKSEIRDQYLSSKKAKSLLGWNHKYDMDSALKETIGWYKIYFGVG